MCYPALLVRLIVLALSKQLNEVTTDMAADVQYLYVGSHLECGKRRHGMSFMGELLSLVEAARGIMRYQRQFSSNRKL